MNESAIVLGVIFAIIILAGLYSHFGNPDRKKKKPAPLSINDFVVPTILPVFKNHSIARGVNQRGNKIYMSWDHDRVQATREYDIEYFPTVESFQREWRLQEINFYLRNTDIFGKSVYKKRVKKK